VTEPERQDDHESPDASQVFDWRTRHTWVMFLGTYLGLGLGAGLAFFVAQVLVHKLLPLENADLKEFLEFSIWLMLYLAGFFAICWLLGRQFRERVPASGTSELLKSPKTVVVHTCGTILGAVAGQILIHILQRLIDLPESRMFIILLIVLILLNGPVLLIVVSGRWGRPRGETNTQSI